jgi:hypothetical protein
MIYCNLGGKISLNVKVSRPMFLRYWLSEKMLQNMMHVIQQSWRLRLHELRLMICQNIENNLVS